MAGKGKGPSGPLQWLVLLILLIFVVTFVFGEELGEDGFPLDYLPEDLVAPLLEQEQQRLDQLAEEAAVNNPKEEVARIAGEAPTPNTAAGAAQAMQPVTIPVSALPSTTTQAVEEARTTEPYVPQDAIVGEVIKDISEKSPLELENRGFLNANNGGFNENVWQGLTRERAEIMLQRLQETPVRSAAISALLFNLLSTEAVPPAGDGSRNWLAVRADTLIALGAAEPAYKLLKGVSGEQIAVDQFLARSWTEAQLLAGDHTQTCKFVKENILNYNYSFWKQALMVCQLMDNQAQQLELSVSVVSDEVRRADPILVNLFEAIITNSPAPKFTVVDTLTPLQSAVFAAYPALITDDVMPLLPDMVWRRLVQSSLLPKDLRVKAAEYLVNFHQKPADINILTALYDSYTFDVLAVKDPVGSAKEIANGSEARALLWQAASRGTLESVRALSLQTLWERASNDGLPQLTLALTPDLRNIKPKSSLAWFAPYAIRSALLAGHENEAKAWWKILERSSGSAKQLMAERNDLAVILSIYGQGITADDLAQWWHGQNMAETDIQFKAERLLAILDAVGVSIQPSLWQELHILSNGDMGYHGQAPGTLWLRLLATSIDAGNVAETLLLVATPLQTIDPAHMAPLGIANMVMGLQFIGQVGASRQLAMEALLSHTPVQSTGGM